MNSNSTKKRDVLMMITQNISYAKIAAQTSIPKGVITNIRFLYKSFLSIKINKILPKKTWNFFSNFASKLNIL
jgi:hypothetical protein